MIISVAQGVITTVPKREGGSPLVSGSPRSTVTASTSHPDENYDGAIGSLNPSLILVIQKLLQAGGL